MEQTMDQSQVLLFLQVQQQEQHHLHQQMIAVYEGNETAVISISSVSGADAAREWISVCNYNYY